MVNRFFSFPKWFLIIALTPLIISAGMDANASQEWLTDKVPEAASRSSTNEPSPIVISPESFNNLKKTSKNGMVDRKFIDIMRLPKGIWRIITLNSDNQSLTIENETGKKVLVKRKSS